MSSRRLAAVKTYLMTLQDTLCHALSAYEPAQSTAKFVEDNWQREAGGGGRTRVLEGGLCFERGGVNFSHVYGTELPPAATKKRPELAGRGFQAVGVSLVLHPRNPYVPTTHMNVRFFIAERDGAAPVWWFGGGFDLTPYYPFFEDAVHWHTTAKAACDPFGAHIYPEYKAWCDRYFYLPHRQETRGIGGLFFDDLNGPLAPNNKSVNQSEFVKSESTDSEQADSAHQDFDQAFAFMQSVGDHFLPAYEPILSRRLKHDYGERERQFQCYRRGRYVEFNLVYDRGTLFGLQSGGRAESILMSLPPAVHWAYDYQPKPGTSEAELYSDYLRPRDWI